jgi:hypothetical protein
MMIAVVEAVMMMVISRILLAFKKGKSKKTKQTKKESERIVVRSRDL